MKTLKFLALASLVAISFSFKVDSELQWQDWNKGSETAKSKNKIALVDVYTDWCGWCKKMDRDTYENAEVIKMINKDFIPIKFNPEIKNVTYKFQGKEYNGKQLASVLSKNRLGGYPTTFFYFPKTGEVKMEVGYLNAERFKAVLNKMVAAKSS